jgi:hypothetical protein
MESGNIHRPLLVLTLAFCVILEPVTPARILSVAFVSSKSHKITYEPLLYELGARGHDVTILAPYISGKKLPGIREIKTIDVDEALNSLPDAWELKEKGEDMSFPMIAKFFGKICADTYDLPQVKAVEKEKFDLIIMQPVFNECIAAWVAAFNTSLVLVSPGMAPPWISAHFGNPTPVSFIPNFMSGLLSDEMNFFQRVKNFVLDGMFSVMMGFVYQRTMDGIFKEKMPHTTLKSSDELFKNASLLLTNTHFSIGSPRPYLPDIIEVGGMHCRPAKPLPKVSFNFLDTKVHTEILCTSITFCFPGS